VVEASAKLTNRRWRGNVGYSRDNASLPFWMNPKWQAMKIGEKKSDAESLQVFVSCLPFLTEANRKNGHKWSLGEMKGIPINLASICTR
jgi:hypothetical protein